MPELDYRTWTYSMRAACAACLALFISFSLSLDSSHWAFTTAYIVGGERQNGQILAKSLARIVGTLVGATASFALVNAFAQERVLFLGCFAAWLSVCAFFSHYQRGHWAYAWVLSGYTTAIVGIPAALTSPATDERIRHVRFGLVSASSLGCWDWYLLSSHR
jgi:uncharacterized membrane protein YccC